MHTNTLKLVYMYTELLNVSAMDVKYKDHCLVTPMDSFRYFYNFILYFFLLYLTFVFYVLEDGHMVGRNM